MAPWPPQANTGKFDQRLTDTRYDISVGYVTSTGYTQNYVTYYQSSATTVAEYPIRNLRAEARKERERRRAVVHMPPPVILKLCTKPMPEKTLLPQPRGVMWLVRAQGGQRERRAARAWIERKDER